MGRPPCCDKANVKKGPWTAEEDAKLLAYTSTHGTGNWTSVPQRAGLKRCGKSCRLRYTNYLRPNLKHENFTPEEEEHIVTLHAMLGSRWSLIANQLPGRTDNDVKNYWNTKLSKKLRQRGIDPITHRPIADLMQSIGSLAIRPPAAATAASSSHLTTTTTSFLPSTKPMLAPLLDPYTGPVVHDTSAPAAVASPELKWSDFLADGNDAALGSYGGGGVLQDVVFDQEAVVLGGGGGGVQGSGGGCDAGAGHDDPAAAAFIDAILECDKEMAADELISELLADPSYYCCSSSEMGWDC